MNLVKRLGALRTGLVVLALVVLAFRPAAGGAPVYEGWALVTTMLVPALTPLVFFGLLLDLLMTWVLSIDLAPAQRAAGPRTILWVDFVLVAAIGLAWIPFYLTLGSG